jgi:hypothetical protein
MDLEPRDYVIIVPDRDAPNGFRLAIGPFHGDQAKAYAYLEASRTEKRCLVLRLCSPESPPDDDEDLHC